MTAKFRKKPVVVDAFQLTYESALSSTPKEKRLPDWIIKNPAVKVSVTDGIENSQFAIIKTLEGEMVANANDWIIKGVKGELYPCKPDIFEQTYEPAASRIARGQRGLWEISAFKGRGEIYRLIDWQNYHCYVQPHFEISGHLISESWAIAQPDFSIYSIRRISDGKEVVILDESPAPPNREAERTEDLKVIIDLFKRFMPENISLESPNQMAMYEAYHRLKAMEVSDTTGDAQSGEAGKEMETICYLAKAYQEALDEGRIIPKGGEATSGSNNEKKHWLENLPQYDGLLNRLSKKDKELSQFYDLQHPIRRGLMLAEEIVKKWCDEFYPLNSTPNPEVSDTTGDAQSGAGNQIK